MRVWCGRHFREGMRSGEGGGWRLRKWWRAWRLCAVFGLVLRKAYPIAVVSGAGEVARWMDREGRWRRCSCGCMEERP